jgi:hypothetical protein
VIFFLVLLLRIPDRELSDRDCDVCDFESDSDLFDLTVDLSRHHCEVCQYRYPLHILGKNKQNQHLINDEADITIAKISQNQPIQNSAYL